MNVIYHQLAVRDVRQILDHYESEAGAQLAGVSHEKHWQQPTASSMLPPWLSQHNNTNA